MNIKTKIVAALTVAAIVLPGISFAQTTTPTIDSIKAEIQSLLVELQTLELQAGIKMPVASTSTNPGGSGSAPTSTAIVMGGGSGSASSNCYAFPLNLGIGSTGTGVENLQGALQTKGLPVSVTGNYDQQTAAAVTNFQEKYAAQILAPNGLQTGTGYVGPSTRQVLNSLFGCTPIINPVGPEPIFPTPTSTPCVISPGSNMTCIISPVGPATSTPPIMCPGGGRLNSVGQCPPLPIWNPVTSTYPCIIPLGSNIACPIPPPVMAGPPCGGTDCLPTGSPTPAPTGPAPVVMSVNPPGYTLNGFSYGAVTITINGSGFTPGGNTVNLQEGSGPAYKIYGVLSPDGKTLIANTGRMVILQSESTGSGSMIGSVINAVPTVAGTYNLSVTNSNGTSVAIPVVVS
jgi:hypothetical protein